MTTDGVDRRDVLRAVASGGAVAAAGGAGGTFLADPPASVAELADLESTQENALRAGEFDLRTAWLAEYDDTTTTVPEQSVEEFPDTFGDTRELTFGFEDVRPGMTGRLLVAVRVCDVRGAVAIEGSLAGSDALADAIEVTGWRPSDWDGQRDASTESELYEGSLSSFPSNPPPPTGCLECADVSGFGFAFTLPTLEDPAVTRDLENESVRIDLRLRARQCTHRRDRDDDR